MTDQPVGNGAPSDDPRTRVEEVLRAMAPTDPGPLRDNMLLSRDLGFDSLRLVELAVVMEESLGLPRVDLDSSLTLSTVKDVTDLVDELARKMSK